MAKIELRDGKHSGEEMTVDDEYLEFLNRFQWTGIDVKDKDNQPKTLLGIGLADEPDENGEVLYIYTEHGPYGEPWFAHELVLTLADCADEEFPDEKTPDRYERFFNAVGGVVKRVNRDDGCLDYSELGRLKDRPWIFHELVVRLMKSSIERG